MLDLSPCPFCAGAALVASRGLTSEQRQYAILADGDRADTAYVGRCRACGATGPEAYREADAAAKWNRRS
jgi:Lar family restriction alleviation protein